MSEFDRLFTLKDDATDLESPQIVALNDAVSSESATIQGFRLFEERHIGSKESATIFPIGLVGGVEQNLNDFVFDGFKDGDTLAILGRVHDITHASVVDNPSFAPPGVEKAIRVLLSPGVYAVNAGEVADYLPADIPTPPTIKTKKIWVRFIEKITTENIVTLTGEGPPQDVKSRSETARFASRYSSDITTKKIIVDDEGVEWDIVSIEKINRGRDLLIDAAREELII